MFGGLPGGNPPPCNEFCAPGCSGRTNPLTTDRNGGTIPLGRTERVSELPPHRSKLDVTIRRRQGEELDAYVEGFAAAVAAVEESGLEVVKAALAIMRRTR